ncbi:hypothetical protein ASE85_10935 [Sphingobium sp. Leaf26]|nr:hypothetical protein ASE85_10935 [Sphingobium sp. Leaf26]
MLEAGQHLFAQRAVEGVTVDDIVAKADVAKGSFYNHFDDKNAFADEIFEDIGRELELLIAQNNEAVGDPALRVSRALCTVLQYARENPDRTQALLSLGDRRASPVSPLNDGLSADVGAGLSTKRFSQVGSECAILSVVGLIAVTVRHVLSDAPLPDPVELASAMSAALLRVLGIPADEATILGIESASAIVASGARC